MEQIKIIPNATLLSYSNAAHRSITHIADMMLSLTDDVQRYHGSDDATLLLNISPSTIEVRDHALLVIPSGYYPKALIQSNSLLLPDFPAPWAPPEVRHKEHKRICAASDIFSIGAVLFWLVYNRIPTTSDVIFIYKMEFPFELTRGSVCKKLRYIFQKTLNNSVKSRLQNLNELQVALHDLKRTTSAQ